MHPFSRRLDDNDLIEHFLKNVLEYNPENLNMVILKIKEGEFQIRHYTEEDCTLRATNHRNREWKENTKRWELRNQIVSELLNLKRLANDEAIALGNGGALPNSATKNENKAFVVIGLPASGKSGIANTLADDLGAIILDSDFAKRKIPEFENGPGSASLVHDESDMVIFGSDKIRIPQNFKPLFQLAMEQKLNLVIPKIGHNLKSINQLGEILKHFGYETHLICVNLNRVKATIRAVNRFLETERYVPLGLIFDGYANDPLNTYFMLKDHIELDDENFASFALISTDVEIGYPPKILQRTPNSPTVILTK